MSNKFENVKGNNEGENTWNPEEKQKEKREVEKKEVGEGKEGLDEAQKKVSLIIINILL